MKKRNTNGFTIVELLIVIVVIGILAAITIVAFNGIQSRAKGASARSLAQSVLKKAEIYNSSNGQYPTIGNFTAAAGATGAAAGTEAALPAGVTLVTYASAAATGSTALTANNGTTTVAYLVCASGGSNVGIEVTYWDYPRSTFSNTAPSVSFQAGQIIGTCA